MQLKNYQKNCLSILKDYFEQCRITGHIEAFNKITSEPEIAERLVNLKNKYTAWDAIPNTPRVCIKVPTGGGKTIIAAHTIKIVAQTWRNTDYPLVLWFVPSDTIRRQTKNPRHPYRVALDEQFEGKVRIFDLDEKFNIRNADIADNVCIIVSTMQSFVKQDTQKYNVYRDNENLEPHFVKMPAAKYAGMEIKEENSRPKYSFSNLLYYHRPIMIVDEAHKVVTDLSQETQRRLNPSAIIEFTATPQTNNNTLYNVRALELKEEEMIKLPIALYERTRWEEAVDQAIIRRDVLEEDAKNEKEYIRPILLFQAQSKDKEVTVEVLKKYLLENAKINEQEIKIATGEQKELDTIDLFNPDEPTRYIITVEALKEGWDCSFAYVLCSLANVKSNTTVEQLLGRVMRMPYAKNRKTPSLNKAYAYVVSSHFDTAEVIIEKLRTKGFDNDEAAASVQQENPAENNLDPNWGSPHNAFILTTKIDRKALPPSIELDSKNTLFFNPQTTPDDIKVVCDKITKPEAASLQWKFNNYKQSNKEPSPADKGITFKVPKLMVELDGQLVFADANTIFEYFDWNIGKYAPTKLEQNDFNIEETSGKGFFIDIDGNRLTYNAIGKDQLLPNMTDIDVWTVPNLILWLDRNLKQDDIPRSQMVEWLRKIIEHLTVIRKITLPNLIIAKFALLNKLFSLVSNARSKARAESYYLFQRENRKVLDFKNGFVFKKDMYDIAMVYYGSYHFKKHFLNQIPFFDGGEKGEECECAKVIDAEPQVKYWIRNISKDRASFRLPTSTDFFYPDFVALLEDNRILVVEYKGRHLLSNDDTKEKENIGLLWEALSEGKGLFLLASKGTEEKTLEQQIKEKIERK